MVGQVIDLLQRISPQILDNLLLLISFAGQQRTNKPRDQMRQIMFWRADSRLRPDWGDFGNFPYANIHGLAG